MMTRWCSCNSLRRTGQEFKDSSLEQGRSEGHVQLSGRQCPFDGGLWESISSVQRLPKNLLSQAWVEALTSVKTKHTLMWDSERLPATRHWGCAAHSPAPPFIKLDRGREHERGEKRKGEVNRGWEVKSNVARQQQWDEEHEGDSR